MWRWNRAARRLVGGAVLGALVVIGPAGLVAQGSAAELAVRFAGWTAVAGFERAATDSLLALLPGSVRDRAGNVVVTLGRGAPRRLASCAVDEPGYVVGAVTDDGYLRLRRVPGAAPAPLFDQALEGQRVTLAGDAGPVPGVVAVRSVHLARFRAAAEAPFTVDDAFVDVGAASRAEAEQLGLHVLTPVALAKRPHRYGDRLLAAPVAGARAACAALAAAVLARPEARGTVVAAFTVQSRYANTGLRAVAALAGPFAEERLAALGVRYEGTPVETVSLAAADSLARALVAWIEGR
jgi:putative aminopeptidase FrvX